jgi:hypothetical protein
MHVAAVGVPLRVQPGPHAASSSATSKPSIDEFGVQRRAPYTIVATAVGTSLSQSYAVHVDMGPRLVLEEGVTVDGPMGDSANGRFGLHRVERFDRNSDHDFRPVSVQLLRGGQRLNVPIHVSVHRLDGADESRGRPPADARRRQ